MMFHMLKDLGDKGGICIFTAAIFLYSANLHCYLNFKEIGCHRAIWLSIRVARFLNNMGIFPQKLEILNVTFYIWQPWCECQPPVALLCG
jgi:hypothetical protein